jgi:putative spermidine/putrescine transport system ATP-binding protein/spermidine/putrescine transport system ATP-binding protein
MSSMPAERDGAEPKSPPAAEPERRPASLQLDGVTKRYGEVIALKDAALRIAPGEFVTLLGPSGCGKTTLLNLIAGFIEPDAGEIFLDGKLITRVPTWEREIGMVFQNYALFPHMTVARNVGYGLRMRGAPRGEIAERVAAALAMVRLEGMADRKPRQLSGGQQQRVALARALVINPKVLLLDEPLSALDKNLRASMQIELRELQQRLGVTAVFVTHDQGEALSLSDRIVVMADGVIRQIGAPQQIYNHPADRSVASFIGDVSVFRGAVAGVEGGRLQVALGQARLHGPAATFPDARPGAAADIFIRPEVLRIAAPGEAAIAQGVVAAQVFQGGHTDILVDTAAAPAGRVMIRAPATDLAARLAIGGAVNLSVAPQHELSIFPPDAGKSRSAGSHPATTD